MKSTMKLTLTLLMGAFFTYQANAQAFFGVYGGLNQSGISMSNWKTNTDPGDLIPTFESANRLTFGVNCELPLSKYVIFQPEIAWAGKGGTMKIDSATGDIFGGGLTSYKTTNNLSLHYFQLPLLIKFRMQLTNPQPIYPQEGTGRPLFFEFYLGPVVNYLLMARSNYTQTVQFTPVGATEPDPAVTKTYSGATQAGLSPIDFSLALGGNLMYKLSRKTHLYFGARYSLNFMDINNGMLTNYYLDANGNETSSNPTIKNSGNLAITIGVSTTFTQRRYWDHPRMKKRRF